MEHAQKEARRESNRSSAQNRCRHEKNLIGENVCFEESLNHDLSNPILSLESIK
jgi:hypothetical protein